MKSQPDPNRSKKTDPDDAFAIPDAAWPNPSVVAEILSSIIAEKSAPQPARAATYNEPKTDYFKVIVAVATNVWRARADILPERAGETPESTKRLKRHIDEIYNSLGDFGIVIRDHTGEPYDESQALKVVESWPKQGLDRKRVSETVLPSIYWNERLIQSGEVKIATPLASGASAEAQLNRP